MYRETGRPFRLISSFNLVHTLEFDPAQGTKDKTLLNGPFKMGRKNCYGVGFGIKSFMKGIWVYDLNYTIALPIYTSVPKWLLLMRDWKVFFKIEKILRILPGVSLFLFVWLRKFSYIRLCIVYILSLGDCVYDCEMYEMVSESSSDQEIHFEFCSVWSVQVYGRRK